MALQKKNQTSQTNFDSWDNVYEAISKQNNNKYLSKYNKRFSLPETVLTELFRQDGLGKVISTLPPFYMLKEGFNVTNDTENELEEALEEINMVNLANEHFVWSRVYGGSLCLAGINDGGTFETPLNEDNIKEVEFFQVWDKNRISVRPEDLQKDPKKPRYYQPVWYTIKPYNSPEFKVHHTRCHVLSGMLTPISIKRDTHNLWGDSVFQSVFDGLQRLTNGYVSTDKILNSFIQIIVNIENLQAMIAAGQKEQVLERLEIIQAGLDINNLIMLDAREKFDKSSSSVNGIPATLQELYLYVSAITRIPVTLLMTRSPAGENSTGEHDMDNWHDTIRYEQNNNLKPFLKWIINLVQKDKSNGIKFQDKPKIKFNPLKQLTDKERSEIYKNYSEGDQTYMTNDVIVSDEARQRFSDDGFQYEFPLLPEFNTPVNRVGANGTNQTANE